MWRERSRDLITFAVSNPFIPGICTSSRMTANSRRRTSRSASSPDVARTRCRPSGSRMASSASRFSGRSSTSSMSTSGDLAWRCARFPSLARRSWTHLVVAAARERCAPMRRRRWPATRETAPCARAGACARLGTARSAARGIDRTLGGRGSCTIAMPPRSTMRRSPREPSSFAPVSTTPTLRRRTLGDRLEDDVDRGPAVPHWLVDGQREDVRRPRAGGSPAARGRCSLQIGSLSSTSHTGSDVQSWSSSRSASDSLLRCCTNAIGTAKVVPGVRARSRGAPAGRPTTRRRRPLTRRRRHLTFR